MNSTTPPPEDPWESDAVWKLIDEAPSWAPHPSFADDVVRLAKLEPPPQPWWKAWFAPLPFAGITAAAAFVCGMVFLSNRPASLGPEGPSLTAVESPAPNDPYADLQDLAETEVLIAAADHLDAFSDQELGNLIGF